MDQGDDGMAGDGGSSKPGNGARNRRAPPPTIELTATPVPGSAGAPDTAAAPDPAPAPVTMESAPTPAPGATNPDATKPDADQAAAKTLRDSLKFAHPIEEMPHQAAPPPPPPPETSSRRLGVPRSWAIGGTLAAAVLLTAAVAIAVSEFSGGVPDAGANQRVTDRLGAIETQLGQIETRLKSSTDPKDIATLGARIAELELKLRTLPKGPTQADVDPNVVMALEGRINDVTKRLAALEPMGKRLDDIAARIAKMETALGQPRPGEPDPALSGRVTAVDTAVKSLAGRIGDLEKRIDTLASAVRETAPPAPTAGGPDEAIRFAFLATALRTAVERGEPFAAELAALKTLAPGKTSLAPLDAFAASGTPSTSALSRELSALVPALLAAANPPRNDGGLADRLGIATRQLIRVRRVGDAPGDDPVSVIARIEVKAAHDDLAGALAEFAKLPENVRAPAAAWIKKATQRIAAVEATRQLAADALAGLANPAPKPTP